MLSNRFLTQCGLLVLLALAASIPQAQAHLAVVRQGPESRGSHESGDIYGRSIAVGDFNGDGFDDMAAGAPFEDVSGVNGAGAVIVSLGSEFGITDQGAQTLLQSDGDALEAGASFGSALAAGDFDSDGYDDLAVGAPSADYDASHTGVGFVFVYAGGPGGLSYWHYLYQPSGGGSLETGDRFGASLAAGNFNGLDGSREDLAVGSPGEDSSAGVVFWFTGGTNGLLNGSSGWFKQSTLGGTNVAGDQFGFSVGAGQLQGAGYDEIIAGAPYRDVDGTEDAGVVWTVLGSTTGPTTSSARMIRPDEGDLPNSPYPDGLFGWSVAAGRFWGGSFDGIAIGEPGRSYFGHPRSGRVVVGKGSTFGYTFNDPYGLTFFQDDLGWALGEEDGFGRALAAGYYDASDGGEDLIIGSPSDNSNGAAALSGVVSVLFGGPNGPGGHGYLGWAQDAFNDDIAVNDVCGTALAIGRFDSTERGNLAVGAPGDDTNAGQVFIVAPWRQVQYGGFKSSVAVDCEGNRIYSHKPYDELQIASTTKIMTVLIACERIQLPTSHPDHYDSNEMYEVPDWIRNNIGGSRYEFLDEQRLTLWDLLFCCIFPSGNDAAFAIADLLTGSDNFWFGEYDNTCQDFVDEMNERAVEIGMTNTHFTNPAGLDKGLPYSTAADMALLAEVAMANPTFQSVVDRTVYTFNTSAEFAGIRHNYYDTIEYGWLQGLQNVNSLFCGVKPGRTPRAKSTGVFSLCLWPDPGISVSLGNVDGAACRTSGDALMDLAISECGGSLAPNGGEEIASRLESFVGDGPSRVDLFGGDGTSRVNAVVPFGGSEVQPLGGGEAEPFRVDFGELSTHTGDHSGGMAELEHDDPRIASTQLDLLRPTGSGLTRCNLQLFRSAEVELDPAERVNLGIGPFQGHGGLGFINHGETAVTILVNTSHTGTPMVMTLDPGERESIAPYMGSEVTSFLYSVENTSTSATVTLGIQEEWIWAKTGIPAGPNPYFTAQLLQGVALLDQAFRVHVTGTDSQTGRSVYVSLHDPEATVDVPSPAPDTALTMRVVGAWPNPFGEMTRLGFELTEPGSVRLEVFDAAGRRVRMFEHVEAQTGTGGFDWDGSAEDGHTLSPGVYFYKMLHNGREQGTGQVTLVR